MRPVTVTVVGAATSDPILVNYRQANFKIGLGFEIVSGNVSYSLEHSFDGTNWFPYAGSTLTTATTALDGNYAFPIKFVRLINANTGTIRMTLLQGN